MSSQISRTGGAAATIIGTLALLIPFGATACGLVPAPNPTAAPLSVSRPTTTLSLLVVKNALGGFPFPPGTTWVYSEVEYQQVVGDPTATITATRLITETVTPIDGIAPSVSFRIKRDASVVSAPSDWDDAMSNGVSDSVYRIEGNQIFSIFGESSQMRTLVYDFPFIVGKSWCPEQPLPDDLPSCHENGLRQVENRTSYAALVGTFDECYDISEEYNSGGVREWFCNGIGVVAREFDHSGTREGFEDKLINYSRPLLPGTSQ